MRIGELLMTAFMFTAPLVAAAQEHTMIDIPTSIQEEHRELNAALERAMKRDDAVGRAARELAAVLHPHFVREELVALPPLAALAPLSRREPMKATKQLIAMSDTLVRELPRMLQEHRAIEAATEKLRTTALIFDAPEWVRFATELRRHALLEEEVYYPAAVLVGRLLRQPSP